TGRDNGGVHINSGIPNHAFYLAATTLGGHAWERAGQIWYDVLTGGELDERASFADFANLTVKAARERFGNGDEFDAVEKAWEQVGVGQNRRYQLSLPSGPVAGQVGRDYACPVPPGHTPPGPDVGGDDDDEW
ncbi:M4 family metallopeptidase, partial [Streptomyces sp. NPDC002817]|uniref:M4 family metallopeptidase n=1 Tax=Streptomyces sp. NPDC088357 TaxID=3154655 RepID=UPI003426B31B